MKEQTQNKGLYLILAIWFLINLIQASLTELSYDEAYYWMYSRFLDWGYFDHPPMVAILDAAGYAVIPNEIGVRLPAIILTTASIYLIHQLVRPRSIQLFGLIIFATVALNIIGFISLPDNPLLFFTCLFFIQYRRYLNNPGLLNSIVLGVIISLMLYSKYHGILVIFFTLLSNWKLIKRRSFWIVALVSVLCFFPHIYWQFSNDFPTLKYHFVQRDSGYKLEYTYYYLGQQLFFFYGIGMGALLLYATLRRSSVNHFESALKLNSIGFLVFFFLMSFKGRTEANWTIPAYPGLIYFLTSYIESEKTQVFKLPRWKTIFGLAAIVPLALRIHTVHPLVHLREDKVLEFQGWKKFNSVLEARAGNLPIAFTRYQHASKYAFYSGKYAPVISVNGRKSQFDLWSKMLDTLRGQPAMLMTNFTEESIKDSYEPQVVTPLGEHYNLIKVKELPNYNAVHLLCPDERIEQNVSQDSLFLRLTLVSNNTHPVYSYKSAVIHKLSNEAGKVVHQNYDDFILDDNLRNDTTSIMFKIPNTLKRGTYTIYYDMYTYYIGHWSCGCSHQIEIK